MPGKKRKPSQSPAQLMSRLSRRGPHRVLRGDLGIVGVAGQVFTPDEGRRLPAIAFGHGWLAGSARYRDLIHHLASWGIVVAVPEGQGGLLASDVGLAADLRSTLAIVSNVPLGLGKVTVDPARIGLAGHGFGASAAVIAASDQQLLGQAPPPVRGVAALFPAPTTGELVPAARLVTAPGVIVAGSGEIDTVGVNALPLAEVYGQASGEDDTSADVVLRTLPGATARGLLERRTLKSLIGSHGADPKTHQFVRALCTGFFLHTLTDDPEYQAFVDPDAVLGKSVVVDLADPPPEPLDKVSRLLGAKPRKRHPLARVAAAALARPEGPARSA
ncbi:dienelactone hydrolase family protein [Gordonia sp. NPDC003422]